MRLHPSKDIIRGMIRDRFTSSIDYDQIVETEDGMDICKGKRKFHISVTEEKLDVKS
jgi:ribosomal protein S3AE